MDDNLMIIQFDGLSCTDFAALAQLNLAINLDQPIGNQEFCKAATLAKASDFQQAV
jgi:hypothetical protein